jgi:hypothetical protein
MILARRDRRKLESPIVAFRSSQALSLEFRTDHQPRTTNHEPQEGMGPFTVVVTLATEVFPAAEFDGSEHGHTPFAGVSGLLSI